MSKRKNYGNYYNEKKGEDLVRGFEEGLNSEDVDVKAKVNKIVTNAVEAVDGEYPKDREREIIPTLAKVVKCNKLNVRKEPNAKSEIITVLDEGSTVEIVSTDISGFRKIKTAELEGYCMSFYIEEIE